MYNSKIFGEQMEYYIKGVMIKYMYIFIYENLHYWIVVKCSGCGRFEDETCCFLNHLQ